MKKLFLGLLLLAFLPTGGFAQMRVAAGSLDSIYMDSQYVGGRMVYIWTPSHFNPSQQYAVLYMNDGQSLFDPTDHWKHEEWRVDEIMDSLTTCQAIIPTIVVGIPCSTLRAQEYIPQKAYQTLSDKVKDTLQGMLPGKTISDEYLKYVVTEIKPYIDSHYPVYTDAAHTFMAGSSMGGLISMYAVCEYPDVFSGAACLSTHWVGGWDIETQFGPAFPDYMDKALPSPKNHKFYFDHGTLLTDSHYEPFQKRVDTVMAAHGYGAAQCLSLVFEGASHSEQDWSRRLAIPMKFLLGDPEAEDKALDASSLAYLQTHYMTPEAYVLSKCAQYDVVFLGEDHRIHENLAFAQRLLPLLYEQGVYNFGMEFGAEEDQARLDSLVTAPAYDEDVAREIMFSYNTGWAFKEYMDMYRAAWDLNHSLPRGARKFRIINLSYRFNWLNVPKGPTTPEVFAQVFHRGDCEQFRADVVEREIMAKGEKIVILTGGSHALTKAHTPYSSTGFGNIVYQRHPDQVYSIFLHGLVSRYADTPPYYTQAGKGRIETLMAALGNKPMGMDVAGTPLGRFSDNSYLAQNTPGMTLGQAIDGYIFLKPCAELTGCAIDPLFITEDNWEQAVAQYPDQNIRTIPASIEAFYQELANYAAMAEYK